MTNRTRPALVEHSEEEDEWNPPEDFCLTEVPPLEEHDHTDFMVENKIDEQK